MGNTYLRKGIELVECYGRLVRTERVLTRCSGNKLPARIFVENLQARGDGGEFMWFITRFSPWGRKFGRYLRQAAMRRDKLEQGEADVAKNRRLGLQTFCF